MKKFTNETAKNIAAMIVLCIAIITYMELVDAVLGIK